MTVSEQQRILLEIFGAHPEYVIMAVPLAACVAALLCALVYVLCFRR
jgi:hypothetical protein